MKYNTASNTNQINAIVYISGVLFVHFQNGFQVVFLSDFHQHSGKRNDIFVLYLHATPSKN